MSVTSTSGANLFLEQLAHQLHGCSAVAPPLHQEIENFAFIVDRAPEPELLPRDRYGHLVEMPARRWPRTPTAKFSREQRPELQDPASHRFVGDIQPTLREQIFDVAIAEREAHIEPNGVPDDHRRELMARDEIVMRNVTWCADTRYRSCDNAGATLPEAGL